MNTFSLLIPHKNSSALLRRLIKSCLQVKMQIIVVDDGSCDEEYKLVEEMRDEYSFELYKNEGIYAGGARNTALKYAKGEWIVFADADDYFTPLVADLFKKHKDSDADIVYFNITSAISDTGEKAYRDEHIKSIAKRYLETGDENYLRCCYTAPWGKLYKRDFIKKNNILFDEVIAANDMMFSIKSGLKANKITYEEQEFYCNTISAGSITTTLSKDRFESKLNVTLRVNDLLRENNKKKYRVSVLYFLGKSYQFGMTYTFHVIKECVKHRSNFFIGTKKLFHYKKVLRDRQNASFTVKK